MYCNNGENNISEVRIVDNEDMSELIARYTYYKQIREKIDNNLQTEGNKVLNTIEKLKREVKKENINSIECKHLLYELVTNTQVFYNLYAAILSNSDIIYSCLEPQIKNTKEVEDIKSHIPGLKIRVTKAENETVRLAENIERDPKIRDDILFITHTYEVIVRTIEIDIFKSVEKGLSFSQDLIEKMPTILANILIEINGCILHSYWTAAAILMRKTLEIATIIKFQQEEKEHEIMVDGDYNELPKRLEKAKQNGYFSSSTGNKLIKDNKIKLFGDIAAHSYRVEIKPDDVGPMKDLLRVALDELKFKK